MITDWVCSWLTTGHMKMRHSILFTVLNLIYTLPSFNYFIQVSVAFRMDYTSVRVAKFSRREHLNMRHAAVVIYLLA